MDAIVLAGSSRNPEDPIFNLAPNGNKALLPIAGKPMLQWVLDALHEAGTLDKILILGQTEAEAIMPHPSHIFLPDHGGIVANVQAGATYLIDELRRDPDEVALSVSSDIPAITAEMVLWLIDQTRRHEADFYYGVITQQTMEAKFPTSKRTYVKLKDMTICGSDINAVRLGMTHHQSDLATRLAASRKNVLKQAGMIGLDTLLLLLLRAITLEETVGRISRKMGFVGTALPCPHAEMGMDVDKPFQYEIVNDYLMQRLARNAG